MIKAIFELMEVLLVNPFEKIKSIRPILIPVDCSVMGDLSSGSLSFCPRCNYDVHIQFEAGKGKSFTEMLKTGCMSPIRVEKKRTKPVSSKFKMGITFLY